MSFSTIAQNLNSGISNGREFAQNQVNALLQPKTAQGIGGFLFDVPREENIELATDVTDHFTENNSFINDHVVNLPIIVTLTGFQGELLFERPSGIAGAVQQIQNRLETVEAYAGARTPGFVQQSQAVVGQVQNAISTIDQTIARTQNIVGLLGNAGDGLTRQQQAYGELNALRLARAPVTLQTPWRYFDSMIITSISFVQPENSEDISEISVSLKEFRVAEVQTVAFDEDLFPVRQQIQSSAQEDQGPVGREDRDISSLRLLIDAAGGG